MRARLLFCLALLAAPLTGFSQQGYPRGPVTMVVPYASGGITDMLARLVAEKLSLRLGVPVVAENRWGWREMIRHGETGYLADSDDELAFYATRLGRDETCRQEIAHRARQALENELANAEVLWANWRRVLENL